MLSYLMRRKYSRRKVVYFPFVLNGVAKKRSFDLSDDQHGRSFPTKMFHIHKFLGLVPSVFLKLNLQHFEHFSPPTGGVL
jgi:hypothetical protein